MSLQDFAGVFSRYFVVGFFVPAFFGLAAAAILLSKSAIPVEFSGYGLGTQFAIIGGLAVPVGLLLQGLYPSVLAALAETRTGVNFYRFISDRLYALLVRRAQAAYDRLRKIRDDPAAGEADRATAAWKLDQRFPEDRTGLLPTRFGNILQATQDYAYSRWALDTYAVWPRVEAVLSPQEQELLENRETEIAFSLNSAIASTALGIAVIADEVWNKLLGPYWGAIYLVPFALSYIFYSLSVSAAVRWCATRRSSIDLHRLELFEKLGLRMPSTVAEQHAAGHELNRFILYGTTLPDAALSGPTQPERPSLLRRLRSYFFGGGSFGAPG